MSSVNKHVHNVVRTVEHGGFKVKSVTRLPGHLHLVIEHEDGRLQRVAFSGTPGDSHVSAQNVLRDVKHFARGVYGEPL